MSKKIVTTSRYVVPTGRVKVPAGRYVVPTGKDNVIVSAGRSNVIPAGRTILVLVVDLSRGGPTFVSERWFEGNDESKKMRNSMLKQEFSEFRVSESDCLHKGYDRFQKILSQLNQMQAKPDNEDCNMKFLRALPPSWSQVAITLKTKGGLDYLSFDDLYNKLRALEINVKGGSSYDSRGTSTPTHSAFISAASTNSKIDPQQQITYEDFDQIGKLDLEELDIKWQMAMLSVRINRFEKKAGRKMKFNNKDAARFDKKKVLFIQTEGAKVYGMIAGAEEDATGNATGNVANDVSNAAAEFALMGISSQ
ncbi:hypothetical protein Tco_0357610, partial [Tanacetum coccineum]